MRQYWIAWRATTGMSARKIFDGSPLCVAAEYMVQLIRMVLLCLIWQALAAAGADLGGFTREQLLTYTLMASVLHQQLNIITPATAALWEGSIVGRYTRPVSVFHSLSAETVGRWWIPVFLFYALPVWCLAPLFGVNPLPGGATAWQCAASGALALCSVLLSASLGFALDLLFAALAMRLKNACWAATQVREAVSALLSGELIPFALLPAAARNILWLLPFGSVANAPLSIYVGAPGAARLLALQIGWNILLWPCALYVFRKSEERMISYGG